MTQISVQDMMLVRAISENGSVSAAAKIVRISQPTASYRLNKLRGIFSDDIFISVNRKMHPTSRGVQISEAFEAQLKNLETLSKNKPFDPAHTSRSFKILAWGFQNPTLLTQVPKVFFKETRNAKLLIQPPNADTPINQQLQESADFIVCPFDPKGAKGIRRFVSPKLKIGVYYDSNVRIPPANMAEFSDSRFVLLDSMKISPSFIDRELISRGFKERQVVGYAPTVETLVQFIEGTDLVFVGAVFETDSRANSIAIADMPFEARLVRHELRWSISAESDPGHRWMRNLITKISRENLPESVRADATEGFTVLSEFETLDD